MGRRAPDKLQLGIACSIPTAFASAPSNRREGADCCELPLYSDEPGPANAFASESDTSSAATDSSTTTGTKSKPGTDTDGKNAAGIYTKDATDSKGDAKGKGDTSTGKADNGSNKASGGKDSSGATSGHKAAHKNK